jgi:hypothetical protein
MLLYSPDSSASSLEYYEIKLLGNVSEKLTHAIASGLELLTC